MNQEKLIIGKVLVETWVGGNCENIFIPSSNQIQSFWSYCCYLKQVILVGGKCLFGVNVSPIKKGEKTCCFI